MVDIWNFKYFIRQSLYRLVIIDEMNYSKAIKALREELLLSQVETAELLGVSFATVNRWENGHHEPTYKAKREIVALCKKHKIKIED